MTAYSLLEEEITIPKKSNTKRWQLGILILGGIAIISGSIIFVRHNNKQDDLFEDMIEKNTNTPPARSFNFNIPTQEKLFYVDLDKYPIEDNVLKLFSDSKESMKTAIIDKILKNNTKDWTEKWLTNIENKTLVENTFACDQQQLPYPILRKMVSEYIPIGNPDNFYDIDNNLDFTKPFVVLPFSKQPKLIQGQKLCVRVVVPYQNIAGNDKYHLLYRPYDHNNERLTSPWWDTMMTTLENINTNATLPITLQPWTGHSIIRKNARELNRVNNQIPEWTRLREDEMYEREKMHIYEATVTLPQDGIYELKSLLEFVEGRYNFEFGPISPYKPVNLPIYPLDSRKILIGKESEKSTSSIEEELLKDHLKLPLCKGFDNAGRWLPWPKMNNSDEYALKEDLHLIAGLTRDGKYWAPYKCRYRHISYEQFTRCAAKKYSRGIDLYGDSNIRRSIKKFRSQGQWCKNWEQHIDSPLLPQDQLPNVNQSLINKRQDSGYNSPEEYRYINPSQTRSCYCEDYSEEYWKQEWFNGNARRFDLQYTNSPEQSLALGLTEWDDKVTGNITYIHTYDSVPVSSYKWDGLTYLNSPPWDTAVPSSSKPVDIAIFSLGNWDAAFAKLEPFLNDVEHLIRQIKEHYDLSKTRIIYRTAQYYCCRIDTSGRTRQVSGPRMDAFDKEVQLKFKLELKAEIWDTYTLGESKPWDEKITSITCPSNHVPADQVEIENQVLMNGLCNL